MENLEKQINLFIEAFCPYGCLDIQMAVKEAMYAGFDGNWAFEQINNFCEECDLKFPDIDPCFVVMDAILQTARNEIDDLTGFDVMNNASFYVDGNYLASSYQSTEEDREKLIEALLPYFENLSELTPCCLYWLAENNISHLNENINEN